MSRTALFDTIQALNISRFSFTGNNRMKEVIFPIELIFIVDSKTTEIEVRSQGAIINKAIFIPAGIELVAAFVK